jgi:hypothetical protein
MRSASLLPRRVSNDHIIQFGGQDREAPQGLDGEQVEVTDLSKRDFCRELCQATGARSCD